MLAEKKINDVLYFFIPYKEYDKNHSVLYTIQPVSNEEYMARQFQYHSFELGKRFVQKLARTHQLDGIFSPEEIEKAKRTGATPEGYDVHHIIPLNIGGSNKESNFCLIDKVLHQHYHSKILDYVTFEGEENVSTALVLPRLGPVVTFEVAACHLFSSEEIKNIRIQEEAAAAKRVYKANRKKVKQKLLVSKKKAPVLLDAKQINTIYKRKEAIKERIAELEERKALWRDQGKPQKTYKDSRKYHTSTTKEDRHFIRKWLPNIKSPQDLGPDLQRNLG